MSCLRQIVLFLFLGLGIGALDAQNVEYGVALDTNYMMIGDQQHLTFKVKGDPGLKIIFPQLKDTMTKGVEIISGPVLDSIKDKDGRWLFEGKYVITAFDSGVYVIPPMPITVEGQEYNNVLRTDPLVFAVNTFQVDPQKGNYDIVQPYAAPWTFAEILPVVLWVLLGIVVLILLWWLWQRHKKNKPLFTPKKEDIPPYVKAIRALDDIKNGKLWQAGREKEYYTRLTDTVRQYLDEEFHIPAMEQTSGETLKALEGCPEVGDKERTRVADMLTTADYVKFAKFTPLQDENARYLDTAYDFVQVTHQRVEAELAAQQQRAAEEKQRFEEEEKKRREAEEKAQAGNEAKGD